jgi:hypothetical protein
MAGSSGVWLAVVSGMQERPDNTASPDNNPRRLLAAARPEATIDETPQLLISREHIIWASAMGMGVAAIAATLFLAWQELTALAQATVRAPVVQDEWTQSSSPAFLEVVSEQALRQRTPDEAIAYLAAKRATDLDPTRAFAWSTLAYLESRRDAGVNGAVLDALSSSMDACPLCDQELIRWRFNFVLTHWNDVPDDLRRRAFEHADLLRWMGPNAEFLAEMRFKAGLQGIPFDAYRAAVNTPARSWDIAPAALLRGAAGTAG